MDDRIKPTAAVAIGVAVLYTVAFISIPVVSGIEYADWFDTAENAARTGIAGLVAGSAVLLAFLVLARWDMLWRDPGAAADVVAAVDTAAALRPRDRRASCRHRMGTRARPAAACHRRRGSAGRVRRGDDVPRHLPARHAHRRTHRKHGRCCGPRSRSARCTCPTCFSAPGLPGSPRFRSPRSPASRCTCSGAASAPSFRRWSRMGSGTSRPSSISTTARAARTTWRCTARCWSLPPRWSR